MAKRILIVIGLVFLGIGVYLYSDNFRAHYEKYSDIPESARGWHAFSEMAMLEATKLSIDADISSSSFVFEFTYPKDKLEALVESVPHKVETRSEVDCSGLFKSYRCYKYGMTSANTILIAIARKIPLSLEEEETDWMLDPKTGRVAGWKKSF